MKKKWYFHLLEAIDIGLSTAWDFALAIISLPAVSEIFRFSIILLPCICHNEPSGVAGFN
jgi:hypothetical protein